MSVVSDFDQRRAEASHTKVKGSFVDQDEYLREERRQQQQQQPRQPIKAPEQDLFQLLKEIIKLMRERNELLQRIVKYLEA